MQIIPQVSTNVSARPLEAVLREEIEQLRAEAATEEQQAEIGRLEAMAVRVRDIDALGERILAAVIPIPTPAIAATPDVPQMRGAIDASTARLARQKTAPARQRSPRKATKKVA